MCSHTAPMGWLEKGPEASFLKGLYQHLCYPPWELWSLFDGWRSSASHVLHTLGDTEAMGRPRSRQARAESARWWRPRGCGVAGPRSLPCTRPLARAQLDKLRTIIENMLASSSTLLSMSMSAAPHKLLTTQAPGQIDPAATCPACSLDLSHQVSMLVQRYEQLQDVVSSLAASRPSKKAKQQSQVMPPAFLRCGRSRPACTEPLGESPREGCLGHFSMMEPFSDRTEVPGLSVGSQRGQP